MALISTGPIIADISGKVGDNIFSRNRGGAYVKAMASPVQPDTAIQVNARTRFTNAAAAWNALTDAEYTAYTAFTIHFFREKFGANRAIPEARSFFIGNYMNINTHLTNTIPTPTMPEATGFSKFELSWSTSTDLRLLSYAPSTPTNSLLRLYSTFAKPAAVRSINSIQKIFFVAFPILPGIPLNIYPQWLAAFPGGSPTSSERLFVKGDVTDITSGIKTGSYWDSIVGIAVVPPYNIGNTDIRTTPTAAANAQGIPVSTIAGGTISGVSVYVASSGGNIKVGLYDDLAGDPNNLLASSGSIPTTATNNWEFFSFSAPFAANPATTYHIIIVGDTGSSFVYDNIPITLKYKVGSGFNLPNPFGVATPFAGGTSIYVTVQP